MGIFDGIILVSDMDGTIINSDKKISERDKKAINYFKENGGLFTIATGRMLPSANRYTLDLDLSLPIILYNGGKIYDYKEEKTLKEYYLEEHRKEIINKLMENDNIGIEVYSDENIYVFKQCSLTKRFSKLGYDVIYDIDESVWKKQWIKILIVGQKEIIDDFEKNFKEFDIEIPLRSAEKYLEIVPKYTSKAKALEELLNLKNLKEYKVVAVGDNMNDIDLIEKADYGFAVKNATDRLLKKAKLIAPSKDDSPIEYIVNWIKENII